VRAYLDESTEPKITRVAEQELIAKQVRPHAARLTLTTAVSWPTGWAWATLCCCHAPRQLSEALHP
jgi:hypothetical protein